MRDFFEILDTLGLYEEKHHNRTSNEYTLNGNLIEFIGLSESARIRGRKRDDVFINEVNETTLDAFRQLAFRTKRWIVMDYNPSEPYSWVYDDVETREDCEMHVTTYKDNPFLDPELIREIELLEDSDDEYWTVYGLGQIGFGGTRIWSHWREQTGANWPYNKGQTVYGLDFGFNNPSALVEVTFYDNTLYWRELLYQSKLTNADLIDALKGIPELRGQKIIADAAEPQRIEEISRAGFKIQPAFKIVKDTIDFVKSKPLRIHSESSNLLREIKRYSWKTDKTGKITGKVGSLLDEVIKFDDHCLDAGRYASFFFNQTKGRFYSF
jgi:phage terminase large subunit